MRKLVLILAGFGVMATAAYLWRGAEAPSARTPDVTADLSALRLMATDLQRSVETLAQSPDPDPATLAALAARLDALTRSLDAIEGKADNPP